MQVTVLDPIQLLINKELIRQIALYFIFLLYLETKLSFT